MSGTYWFWPKVSTWIFNLMFYFRKRIWHLLHYLHSDYLNKLPSKAAKAGQSKSCNIQVWTLSCTWWRFCLISSQWELYPNYLMWPHQMAAKAWLVLCVYWEVYKLDNWSLKIKIIEKVQVLMVENIVFWISRLCKWKRVSLPQNRNKHKQRKSFLVNAHLFVIAIWQ